MTIQNSVRQFVSISIFLAACILFSCAKSSDGAAPVTTTDPAAPPSDGSQSLAQLAGTGTFCNTDTTIGGTYAYVHSLNLQADGTYSYSLYFTDAASCATAQNSAGNNYATYTQSGTFAVGGTAGTPSTGTKVTFTVGAGSLVIRSATYGTIPQNLASWMNSHCAPNPNFSASADQTKSVSANTCVGAGAYTAVVIPAVTDTFTNTVYNAGTTLQVGLSSGQDIWRLGGSTFPTSYSQTFLGWQ